MTTTPRILVIKLSALGDVIQAFPAFERIRAAHPAAHITLLTTPPYEALASASPYFDAVETDGRSRTLSGAIALVSRLRRMRFERVYDLQGADRTNLLFQAMRPFPPAWSGVAFGCSLPHRNPLRMRMHTLERQAEQLLDAGIWPDAPVAPGSAPAPTVDWMLARTAQTSQMDSRPLALLVPGAAPSRPAKRWPADRYAALATRLIERGMAVTLVGAAPEADVGREILTAEPRAANLIGQTGLFALAALGARAALVVGNDTGPMHLLAAAGAPSVVLFSSDSDPALCAPRGRVTVLRAADLSGLDVEAVFTAALARL